MGNIYLLSDLHFAHSTPAKSAFPLNQCSFSPLPIALASFYLKRPQSILLLVNFYSCSSWKQLAQMWSQVICIIKAQFRVHILSIP